MEWVETTGRSVEEAKEAALDQLGVDEQDAEFEVLEEPRGGLFGRLRAEARVRARVRPTRPRPKEDRRERRRRGARSGDGGGRPRKEARPREKAAQSPSPARAENDEEPRAMNDEGSTHVPLDEQAAVAQEFLEGLVDEFGVQATVGTTAVDDDTVQLDVRGDDLGLLIGPRGETLSAVQELARTVVQRRTGARNGRVVVDVAGYRQARRESLAEFTREVADEVRRTGEPRRFEPMHPADRKVVHDTVNELPGVATTSEGEEPRRRVVIVPESHD